jgi:hypothetical protein
MATNEEYKAALEAMAVPIDATNVLDPNEIEQVQSQLRLKSQERMRAVVDSAPSIPTPKRVTDALTSLNVGKFLSLVDWKGVKPMFSPEASGVASTAGITSTTIIGGDGQPRARRSIFDYQVFDFFGAIDWKGGGAPVIGAAVATAGVASEHEIASVGEVDPGVESKSEKSVSSMFDDFAW